MKPSKKSIAGTLLPLLLWLMSLPVQNLFFDIQPKTYDSFGDLIGYKSLLNILLLLLAGLLSFFIYLWNFTRLTTTSLRKQPESQQPLPQQNAEIQPPYFFDHAGLAWRGYENSRSAHGPLCPNDHYELVYSFGNTWRCANDHKFVIADIRHLRQIADTIASKNFDDAVLHKAQQPQKPDFDIQPGTVGDITKDY